MKKISTPNGPEPAGHYSQAVVYSGVVYVAGMMGRAPDADPESDPGGAAEQTRQALRNVEAVLEAAGSGLDRVVQATIYVTDIELWGEVNAAFTEVMGDHKPARAIVPVKSFKPPFLVEIVTTAALA
jgi:2-iminobutanoate/2-iminopropanoate deaminase